MRATGSPSWKDREARGRRQLTTAWIGLALAAAFWLVIFGLHWGNFWTGMGIAAGVLTAYAVAAAGPPWREEEWNWVNVIIGISAALVLYGIFACGSWLGRSIFPFAGRQIGSIYDIQSQANRWLIGLLLLFVTSPAEEIFWRGFLQRRFMVAGGEAAGWLMASLCYAAVHLFSGNLMLILAALVAGLFWGLLYLWRRSLVPGIISHALWTVLVFLVFPLGGSL
ncbi:MAG: CPBP family intramembrane metalloprotease [Limnochordaceae bacterium]|nr:CPBP family intramembrane metalloprotease [Limnochordaceae bacterium]